jgi:hypothetical protein
MSANQKTYLQIRGECRTLRAAHKKIKRERDLAHGLLENALVIIDALDPHEGAYFYDLEKKIKEIVGPVTAPDRRDP